MKKTCSSIMCDSGAKLSDRLISLVAVAAVVGIIVSYYSVLAHYDSVPTGFCSINETFDCGVVNKSSYSEIFGVPVSILGVLAYVALFGGIMKYNRQRSKNLLQMLLMLAAGGVIFSLYLTSIEAFVLYTWCLLCLASQGVILVILGALWKLKSH